MGKCMGFILWILLILLPGILHITASGYGQETSKYFENGVIHIVSSSHQDIGWMDTPERCIEGRDKYVITPALERMKENPSFCFTMENTLCLMEYLERHPERREEIRKLTREGRFEWGATYNQPYESMYSGEALIRQVYLGRKWIKKALSGCDSRTAWNPDVPARALQMPQILAKAGIKYLHMSRHEMGFYRWLSPDGSGVIAYSPGHYYTLGSIFRKAIVHTGSTSITQSNKELPEVASDLSKKLVEYEEYYRQHSISPQLGIIASTDFSAPVNLDALFVQWNNRVEESMAAAQKSFAMPRLKYSTGEGFMDALTAGNPKFGVITGERPNVWLYIHGPTHHRAISAGREAWHLLTAAEIFATIRASLTGQFQNYPSEKLHTAWSEAIYPDHGWGGNNGHITDKVFRNKMESARNTARDILDQSLSSIAQNISVKGVGIPVAVFNPLSWMRTDPVVCTINVDGMTSTGFRLEDTNGRTIPYQVISTVHEGQKSDEELKILFVASDVPSIGYKTYYLKSDTAYRINGEYYAGTGRGWDNDFFHIELGSGGIKSIYDKELNKEILQTDKFLGGELFTMQSVGNGAGEFAEVQQPTMEGFEKMSDYKPNWRCTESGPVRHIFESVQRINHCTVRQRILLYASIKRIDFETDIFGWDGTKWREFRLAFPLKMASGAVAYEVPMGVVQVGKDEIRGAAGERYVQPCKDVRPREVQDWFHASDGKSGVTISSSVAVFDWIDPTTTPVSYPVLQPILLASRKSCHSKGNWYLQAGDHSYRFSLYSHRGDWREGYRFGAQSNQPLEALCISEGGANAALPEEKSFCSADEDAVIISTIKKCEDDDGVIIRCFEIEGKDVNSAIQWFESPGRAERTNIIEEEGSPLTTEGNSVRLPVGHNAIETIKIGQ